MGSNIVTCRSLPVATNCSPQARIDQEKIDREQTGVASASLLHELSRSALALSGVAGVLEERARNEERPLREAELKEALLMRLSAKLLFDDAIQFGAMAELASDAKVSLDALASKVSALCERDEAKDFLHGVLVALMERYHAKHSGLARELDLRPPEQRRSIVE